MLWQAKGSIGAQLVNEPGALVWNELITRDRDAALPFYKELFGWNTSEFPGGEGPPYMLIHLPDGDATMDNVCGGMVQMTDAMFPPEVPPHWNAYVAVDDADATISAWEEAGGSVLVPAMDMPWGRMAVLSDPFGAALTILKMPESQS